jgi:collagenase-like PrtC family protease
MSKPLKYSVPLIWEQEYIDNIIGLEQPNTRVTDFYGCIEDSPFSNGRVPLEHQKISRKKACQISDYIHKRGKRLKYLLNAPDTNCHIIKDEAKKEFITYLLNDLTVDVIVATSLDLIAYLRTLKPRLEIHLSTIAGIKKEEELLPFLPYNLQVIIPHHDACRYYYDFSKLTETCKKNEINIELMVTESCLFECPWRDQHYQSLAERTDDSPFHRRCAHKRFENPASLFSCGSFILPQDVRKFQHFGIDRYKITGRSKGKSYLLKTAEAYMLENYQGNVVNLMATADQSKPQAWIHIESQAFFGMTDQYINKQEMDWKSLTRFYYEKAVNERLVEVLQPPVGVI